MIPNIPTIDQLAASPEAAAELDLESIALLIEDAKAVARRATECSRLLQGEVEHRFKQQIADAYLAKGEDTGTVQVVAEGFAIEVTRAKKVEWDQGQLAQIHMMIRAANDDPGQYMDQVLTVPERKFTAWPDSIQNTFMPARTVKPGAVSIKLTRAA